MILGLGDSAFTPVRGMPGAAQVTPLKWTPSTPGTSLQIAQLATAQQGGAGAAPAPAAVGGIGLDPATIGAFAGLGINLAITFMVDRHKHPIIFWGLGPVGVAYNLYVLAKKA